MLFSNLVALGWPSFNLSPGLSFTRVIYVMAVSSYFMASSFRDSRQLLFCFGRRSCRIGEELLMRAMNRVRELNPCDSEAGGIKAQPAGCSASTQTQLVQSQKGAGLVKLGVTKLSPMSQIQPASHSSVRRRMGFAFLNGWGEKIKRRTQNTWKLQAIYISLSIDTVLWKPGGIICICAVSKCSCSARAGVSSWGRGQHGGLWGLKMS